MSGPITSTSLDPILMQLVNVIANSMVTIPGGSTLVSPTNLTGSVKTQEVDCSALSLQISAPGPGISPQVTVNFPGSSFYITGYVNSTLLSALMNTFPVFTTGTLPSASSFPAGYSIWNSTTRQILVSDSTNWTGAVNFSQTANGNQIGPATSVSFNSPNIQHKRSGQVFVHAELGGTLNAQDVVTVSLYRDGTGGFLLSTSIGSPGGTSPIGFSSTAAWIDTLPDDAPHYYTVLVTAAGANITIPIGGANFQVIEL